MRNLQVCGDPSPGSSTLQLGRFHVSSHQHGSINHALTVIHDRDAFKCNFIKFHNRSKRCRLQLACFGCGHHGPAASSQLWNAGGFTLSGATTVFRGVRNMHGDWAVSSSHFSDPLFHATCLPVPSLLQWPILPVSASNPQGPRPLLLEHPSCDPQQSSSMRRSRLQNRCANLGDVSADCPLESHDSRHACSRQLHPTFLNVALDAVCKQFMAQAAPVGFPNNQSAKCPKTRMLTAFQWPRSKTMRTLLPTHMSKPDRTRDKTAKHR